MNGPSPGFLADMWAPFQAGAQLAGVGSPQAAPVVSVAGQPMFAPPSMPAAPAVPPPAPAPPPAPDPHADDKRGMSVMGPSSSQAPAPPPAALPPAGPPTPPGMGARSGGNEYPLLAVGGGGMTKAREIEHRGPTLLRAQDARNLASEETIGRVGDRNANMAQQEYDLALDQERQARVREAATQQSLIERDEEMAQRQADFDSTVKQLGKLGTIDRDRFWASRSTAGKIAGFAELMLSGFRGTPSMLMKRIDDDVKAQEFAFYATRDTAQAKQTAFSQAMQKYQNADAARAMARAAAIDVTQAQFAQMAAKWKGTEAANRADMAMAALQDEKMMQIANGIQFVPPQYQGRRFIDPRTGLIYSEAEAKAMSAKVDERDFENRKQTAGIGGQLMVEESKAGHELQKALAGKADEGAKEIAHMLQQAGVPAARAAADRAMAALNRSPGGKLEAAARTVAAGVPVVGTAAANTVLSDDANAREQDYWAFANASMKAMMGNVTEGEMQRAMKQLGSASDPESRKRAIQATLETLSEIEKNAKAGASPSAQAEFERRREVAKGDKPVAPPSANKGW